jgi:SAM-dependent methyltransferase
MVTDPRDAALVKFATPDTSGMDVIATYASDPPLMRETVLSAIAEVAPRRVCELGFGTGYVIEWMLDAGVAPELYGLDLSKGMARRAQELYGGRVGIMLGDMERLPFGDGSLDAIVTCFTLYFMNDIDRALAEMWRCLRRGGRAIAATVAPDHMVELYDVLAESMRAALGREPEPEVGERFDLGTGGAFMRRAFGDVELRDWRGTLALPSVEPAVVLLRGYGPQGLGENERAALAADFGRRAQERIERDGAFRIRRHDGAFVGVKR